MSQKQKSAILGVYLLLLVGALVAGDPAKEGFIHLCIGICKINFLMCIQRACGGRPFPLPISEECQQERLQCIEECTSYRFDIR
ncbi:hypothetical protein LSAT2_001867 [Lamellibrachia satsuma]|nr:hypothetical protein LSAT2_001867 [Lamellibrachia satsuma]